MHGNCVFSHSLVKLSVSNMLFIDGEVDCTATEVYGNFFLAYSFVTVNNWFE